MCKGHVNRIKEGCRFCMEDENSRGCSPGFFFPHTKLQPALRLTVRILYYRVLQLEAADILSVVNHIVYSSVLRLYIELCRCQ